MRQGYRVIDMDTHVDPPLRILLQYVDATFPRDALQPYVFTRKTTSGESDELRVKPVLYERKAGQKLGGPETEQRGRLGSQEGRTELRNRRPFAAGVTGQNAAGRLEDMDVEGADVHFIIPGGWVCGLSAIDPRLTTGLYSAYHRYMADYCAAEPRRLKGLLLAPGADPRWAAQTIREHADQEWVSAVFPVLPEGLPIDDPDLAPIWEAANEAKLPLVFHGFYIETPYFPGYRDIWGNAAVARCAGAAWGAQRLLAYVLISGMLDRYPNLNVGFIETGHGWLPAWVLRLTRQVEYVKGVTPPDLQHTPIEYIHMGRVACGIDFAEGLPMTKAAIDVVGEHVFLYQSDYPHPDSLFPDTADAFLAWEDTLGPSLMRKVMSENAAGFFRLASTPWDH